MPVAAASTAKTISSRAVPAAADKEVDILQVLAANKEMRAAEYAPKEMGKVA